ncbi:MAG: chemotaxis protein CheD [Deferrisomatales bacterium]
MGTVHVVGISDCKVSNDSADTVITYALGSCVGIALYDPHAKAGGILHLMLPDSRFRSATRELNPCMYADTGLSTLLRSVLALGSRRERLVAKLAGGANMLRHSSVLDIGKRNAEASLELLGKEGIPILATSLGGTAGRSMQLRLVDGVVDVRLLGRGEEVL